MKLVVVGGGPAAFAGALRAAAQGAEVTLVCSEPLGGTCVNAGCLPSKMLIRAAALAHESAAHNLRGIERHRPAVDLQAHLAQQQARIDEILYSRYRAPLENRANVHLLPGRARFTDPHTVEVAVTDGASCQVHGDRFLIATGASPWIPPISGINDVPFWTSDDAVKSQRLPDHLLVIGGSAVALELGQAFQHLGCNVTLVTRRGLLSREDPAVGAAMLDILQREGMSIHTKTVPTAAAYRNGIFTLRLPKGDLRGDALLVATGRAPNSGALGLENAGVALDARGAVKVDKMMRTNVEHIYAAGDCTTQPQLVCVGAAAGTRAAVNLMGGSAPLDLSAVPSVLFTSPQVATVGLTEARARQHGIVPECRVLPLERVARALVNFDTWGFIKLVARKDNGRLLGAQIVAGQAGEIIQAAALALHNRMTVAEIGDQLFPYLTMVEGLRLCAQSFYLDIDDLSCCAG